MVRTVKINSLSKFQVYSAALLTRITVLYIRCAELCIWHNWNFMTLILWLKFYDWILWVLIVSFMYPYWEFPFVDPLACFPLFLATWFPLVLYAEYYKNTFKGYLKPLSGGASAWDTQGPFFPTVLSLSIACTFLRFVCIFACALTLLKRDFLGMTL